MNLKALKSCIDQAAKAAGDYDAEVEVWLGERCYRVKSVGQFGFIPDVTITLEEEPVMDFT